MPILGFCFVKGTNTIYLPLFGSSICLPFFFPNVVLLYLIQEEELAEGEESNHL